ncbi:MULTISPECIES: DNA-binding protein [Stutzerimonas stutzeri group]|jgi:chromosome segregation ATPase|uniref:DNA-binding protein n=1 Tax=Stutzerimonas stutzeri group TaxID=136846 RepID=UPI00052D2B7A|nr:MULTISPECIES: DNA-binding protein [Stutzerimonas stutzeri group]MAK86324.1 cointegrate resolution protein T [Pseudomonas sp.]MBU0922187.1 DNA-binding protein [Gammaproteobacteria bacterium]CEG51709.1 TnpT protein [Stutzerimonas xanthomarina]KKJ96742.1 cointegrate resolution protein T [Stutzerimonas stutzeri]KZX56767.1 cointegrate resolution protein T [Stutzerimonas frequens]|tara:strand:- start:2283 stop:3281 length:999 start_codon:yes stop_codon:yes gene_type:complete
MARGGINKALVQKARRTILARGENPSIDAVRVELGNTGSKTTIHRYLKEMEETERGRQTAPSLSEQLGNLVSLLAEQLREEAQAAVAQEREQLALERLDYQDQIRQAESRIEQLEGQSSTLGEQLNAAQQTLQHEQQKCQQVELENARLAQANADLEMRLIDRDSQIASLEDKHEHARDALEHYRQASKDQREQDQRRHEAQVQQLQVELRQLRQTLIIKQDELTQLNRDNARLLTEARQMQKDQRAQEQHLTQKTQALEIARSTLTGMERTNDALEQRCRALQDEVARLGEATDAQAQRAQGLQERLSEALAQLKLLRHAPPAVPGNASSP